MRQSRMHLAAKSSLTIFKRSDPHTTMNQLPDRFDHAPKQHASQKLGKKTAVAMLRLTQIGNPSLW